jgi:hypothetical protein
MHKENQHRQQDAGEKIAIASRIEVVSEYCFSNRTSLTCVTFQSNSQLHRIDECAFAQYDLKTIQMPASVEGCASHAFPDVHHLPLLHLNRTLNRNKLKNLHLDGVV